MKPRRPPLRATPPRPPSRIRAISRRPSRLSNRSKLWVIPDIEKVRRFAGLFYLPFTSLDSVDDLGRNRLGVLSRWVEHEGEWNVVSGPDDTEFGDSDCLRKIAELNPPSAKRNALFRPDVRQRKPMTK